MKYKEFIETISVIIENDKIIKNGLSLIYELDEENHMEINKDFFYMIEDNIWKDFIPSEQFEVELGGIVIKFIKKTN